MIVVFSIVTGGYVVFMAVGLSIMGLRALFRRIVYGRNRGAVRHAIVQKARRDRLTAQERERRIRAIYPIPWTPRARWPVSRRS